MAGLSEQLASLGVVRGDSLMVHASMRAVGGRAEALIAALQRAVGHEGCLLLLICAEEDVPFDPATSEAWEELGVLSEVFRTTADVVLNEHPIARFGAWGTGAAALVCDPPLHDYYGPGSPLERLWQAGGKVLRLGADPDTVTLLHYAEYRVELPQKRPIAHPVACAVEGGTEDVVVRCLDDDHGIADWAGEGDYFAAILADYLASGRARVGPVGGAVAELLDARDLVAFGVRWMGRELG